MMGDYNATCGPLLDFIDDIDNAPNRNVIDTVANSYGEMPIDFMMSARNDFTCKDVSDVDYAIIPYEQLYLYKQFKVIHMHDLFELDRCVGKYDPVRHLPDHNLLFWNMDLSSFINVCEETGVNPSNMSPASFVKYDLSHVTDNCLIDQNIERILNTII